jgi:RimJ/RimL family protein N-acetyltransferase
LRGRRRCGNYPAGNDGGTDAIMTPNALRTPRLTLRQWRDDDLDAFAALSSDAAVMAYLMPLDGRAASDAMAARIGQHFARNGFGFWAVELNGKAPFIGVIGLAVVSFEAHFTPAVEVGWRLARAYWGRGYAFEAAAAALEDGFGRLYLDETASCQQFQQLRLSERPLRAHRDRWAFSRSVRARASWREPRRLDRFVCLKPSRLSEPGRRESRTGEPDRHVWCGRKANQATMLDAHVTRRVTRLAMRPNAARCLLSPLPGA